LASEKLLLLAAIIKTSKFLHPDNFSFELSRLLGLLILWNIFDFRKIAVVGFAGAYRRY